MRSNILRSSMVPLLVLATLVFARGLSASTPCRSATDTAGTAVFDVQQMLAASGGDTTGVSLVTDSTTCSAVINSYNNVSDSTLRVSSGYVLQTDSSYVLYLPANGTPFKTQQVVVFDRQFHFVLKMEGVG